MASSGTTNLNIKSLIIREVIAVNQDDTPVLTDQVLVTSPNGIMTYQPYNNSGAWYLTPAGGPVNLNGNNLINTGTIVADSGSTVTIQGNVNITGDIMAGNDINLQGNNLINVDSITGQSGKLIINSDIDIQDNNLINVDSITGQSGKLIINSDIDIQGNNIENIGELSGDSGLITVNDIVLINKGINSTHTFINTNTILDVPIGATSFTFKMVGAGGFNDEIILGGFGGYMAGTVDITSINNGSLVLSIEAGKSVTSVTNGSTASCISIPSLDIIYSIVGAGGGAGFGSNAFTGGHGGGANNSSGTVTPVDFTSDIASGSDGANGPNYVGRGGSSVGGSAGNDNGVTPGQFGNTGDSRPSVETYLSVFGGKGTIIYGGGYGGGGYCGGGGGGGSALNETLIGGGGGGSSYVNTTKVTNIVSYSGSYINTNSLSLLPIQSGTGFPYGYHNNDGYVEITFIGPSLQTSNDIICGGNVYVKNNTNTKGLVYDTVHNIPPVPLTDNITIIASFGSSDTITHNVVVTNTFTTTKAGFYKISLSASNGFSDDTPPPVIPSNGIIQLWIVDSPPFSQSNSQVTLAMSEMVVRPSTAISTYLSACIYHKETGYILLNATTTYTVSYALWADSDLILGIGNGLSIDVYYVGSN